MFDGTAELGAEQDDKDRKVDDYGRINACTVSFVNHYLSFFASFSMVAAIIRMATLFSPPSGTMTSA